MTKMKKYILLLLVFAAFSCTETEKKSNTDGDRAFDKVTEDYIKEYLDWRPQTGVMLGLHEYDGKLADYSKASIDAELDVYKRQVSYYQSMDL